MRHRPQHMHRLADGPCKLRFTRQKGRFLISYKNTKKGWTEQKKQYLFCFYQLYLLISQTIWQEAQHIKARASAGVLADTTDICPDLQVGTLHKT